MKALMTLFLGLMLIGASASSPQDFTEDDFIKATTQTLKGVKKVHVWVMGYSAEGDGLIKQSEIMDRVLLELTRAGIAFKEVKVTPGNMADFDAMQAVKQAGKIEEVAITVSVSCEEMRPGYWSNSVDLTLKEAVATLRNPSKLIMVDTVRIPRSGTSSKASVENQVYEMTSLVAKEFAKGYALNNPK
jgi:hypothetical protein